MNKDIGTQYTTPAGGNVFADLGFDATEAQRLKIKADLMLAISQWVKEKNLKQDEAAKTLKVSRPRVSDVMRGKINKFTIDSLVDMLESTGRHVTLTIS